MTTRHTQEPWNRHKRSVILHEDDYERARACVNACAGIPDPETTIPELVYFVTRALDMDGTTGDPELDAEGRAILAKLDKEGGPQG